MPHRNITQAYESYLPTCRVACRRCYDVVKQTSEDDR